MARSKWNTGTLLNKVEAVADEVQSTVSIGGEKLPKWQALVNTAADAMDVVSDTWTDASGAVSEMLPDQEYVNETVGAAVENVKERAGIVSDAAGSFVEAVTPAPKTLVEGLRFAAPVASKFLPINAAKFAEFLSNDGKIDITPEDLGDDLGFLREKAIETITAGGDRFTYKTWGFEEKSILMADLKKTAAKSFTDPNYRMATLIGQTANGNVRVENGRLVVEDVYDFNSGPRGTKLQQALVLKETGDMLGYEKLAEEALNDLSYFGQMRVWAAALGVPQGQGTRFKIDLGPAPEGLS